MTKNEALKLAYDETWSAGSEYPIPSFDDVMSFANKLQAIKEALVQPEQDPVAVVVSTSRTDDGFRAVVETGDELLDLDTLLYTTPPQRTWVGLTEAQCGVLWKTNMTPFEYYQAIEAALRSKNT